MKIPGVLVLSFGIHRAVLGSTLIFTLKQNSLYDWYILSKNIPTFSLNRPFYQFLKIDFRIFELNTFVILLSKCPCVFSRKDINRLNLTLPTHVTEKKLRFTKEFYFQIRLKYKQLRNLTFISLVLQTWTKSGCSIHSAWRHCGQSLWTRMLWIGFHYKFIGMGVVPDFLK